ncbi:MAG: hypothetical protein WCO98_11595 [bacterium]
MPAKMSFRVSSNIWSNPERCRELLVFLRDYPAVSEVAFFTGFTHPPLPLEVIRSRAQVLNDVVPMFRDAGYCSGINHLSTLGHLDENLENSLREPWQHLVNIDGAVSKSCYCASDPDMQEYIKESYRLLAATGAEFIWVDDDVRLESHPPTIHMGCFCERCVNSFGEQIGRKISRVELVVAFDSGTTADKLQLRQEWLRHNRQYISNLLSLIRDAVDEVNPVIKLGLMTGEISYSGYGFSECVDAMAGTRHIEVKWRPGGGFYEDSTPSGLLGKAHSVGRQNALIPLSVTDLQYEHENFPYQVLKKSSTIFTAECAASIGAGCTGVALNCMGISPDPLDEYHPWFAGVQSAKEFLDFAADTFKRSECEGVWHAFTRDHVAATALDTTWTNATIWGGDLGVANELYEIGIPAAYSVNGARVTVLSANTVGDFTREELVKILSGGVLMDALALQKMIEMGLQEYIGWSIRGIKEKDTIEVLTGDSINGRFAGWQRDCRPSFWASTTHLLQPLTAQSRPLCEIIDFTPNNFGTCSGVFENSLGGRVAILGYYPWQSLQSLAKSSQMKSLCRWLSGETLPAYISSLHKATVWCRRTPDGQPAQMVLNASIDIAVNMTIQLQGDVKSIWCHHLQSEPVKIERAAVDSKYSAFILPAIGPWQAAVLKRDE